MEHAGASRSMLMFHPAGIFFALAATIAVVLPWLWLLPLADPRLAHIRLGLFGFGGMAICGYVMTAQKAWTGHAFPVPALFSGRLPSAPVWHPWAPRWLSGRSFCCRYRSPR